MKVDTRMGFKCQYCESDYDFKGGKGWNRITLEENDGGVLLVAECNSCGKRDLLMYTEGHSLGYLNNILMSCSQGGNIKYMRTRENEPNPFLREIESDEQWERMKQEHAEQARIEEEEKAKRPVAHLVMEADENWTQKSQSTLTRTYRFYRETEDRRDYIADAVITLRRYKHKTRFNLSFPGHIAGNSLRSFDTYGWEDETPYPKTESMNTWQKTLKNAEDELYRIAYHRFEGKTYRWADQDE